MQQLLRRIYDVCSCFHTKPRGNLPGFHLTDDAGVPQGPKQIHHAYVVDIRIHDPCLHILDDNRFDLSCFRKAYHLIPAGSI